MLEKKISQKTEKKLKNILQKTEKTQNFFSHKIFKFILKTDQKSIFS